MSFESFQRLGSNEKKEARSRKHRVTDSLQDLIDNIVRIQLYVGNLDAAGLAADRLRTDAVERCLERVCEAAFRLGDAA
jgi:uncharacterized protein with HEPN domain